MRKSARRLWSNCMMIAFGHVAQWRHRPEGTQLGSTTPSIGACSPGWLASTGLPALSFKSDASLVEADSATHAQGFCGKLRDTRKSPLVPLHERALLHAWRTAAAACCVPVRSHLATSRTVARHARHGLALPAQQQPLYGACHVLTETELRKLIRRSAEEPHARILCDDISWTVPVVACPHVAGCTSY